MAHPKKGNNLELGKALNISYKRNHIWITSYANLLYQGVILE